MKVNTWFVRNILVLLFVVFLNACATVNTDTVSHNGQARSGIDFSQLGITGRNAAIVTTKDRIAYYSCDTMRGGFSPPRSFSKDVERSIGGALKSKGYYITNKESLTANDLLVEVHYRCHSQYANFWLYGFTIGILPGWDGDYLTTTVDLKTGTGSLLGRYRMVTENTGYLTVYTPVALFLGGNQTDAINDFSNSVSSSFR
jgi:hypothetical protein